MQELAFLQSATGETIHLAVPDGDELVLVERLDSAQQLRAFLALGTRLPLHAAVTGKAYLATPSGDVIEAYLGTRLSKVTASTITDPGQLREEIQTIRQRGYATTADAFNEGISAVAVAVRDSSGPAHACFSISGPSSRLTADRLIDYAGLALKARAAIEDPWVGADSAYQVSTRLLSVSLHTAAAVPFPDDVRLQRDPEPRFEPDLSAPNGP